MADWPHAPVHRLGEGGAYIVTAATYGKYGYFATPAKLTLLQEHLLSLAPRYSWRLQAWAVLSNHYHFIAVLHGDADSLRQLIRRLHSATAREVNRLDDARGRRVWFQYWDTHLTYERSYLARLCYVHENPVHHGLALSAAEYPWCSARWFEASATPAFFKTVMSLKTDRIRVLDDFDVECGGEPPLPALRELEGSKAGACSRTPKYCEGG